MNYCFKSSIVFNRFQRKQWYFVKATRRRLSRNGLKNRCPLNRSLTIHCRTISMQRLSLVPSRTRRTQWTISLGPSSIAASHRIRTTITYKVLTESIIIESKCSVGIMYIYSYIQYILVYRIVKMVICIHPYVIKAYELL